MWKRWKWKSVKEKLRLESKSVAKVKCERMWKKNEGEKVKMLLKWNVSKSVEKMKVRKRNVSESVKEKWR